MRSLPPLDRQAYNTSPAVVDTVLPNGLRVIAAQHATTPMVELRMALPLSCEGPEQEAAAEVLAATLLRGSDLQSYEQMDAILASLGITLEASRSPRWLNISGSAPGTACATLLSALAESLIAAAHRDEEVRQAVCRMGQQISVIRAQPHVLAREALLTHCYGELEGLREVPLPEHTHNVTAGAVRRLHRAAMVPSGAVLVLIGDIAPEEAVALVASATADWQGHRAWPTAPRLPEMRDRQVVLVPRAGAVQSQIRLARPAVSRADERFPALSIAVLVFGGYFSSRLVTSLRENKGLAYHVDAGFQDHLDRLVLTVDADTATDNTAAAYEEIRAELGRMTGASPSGVEIDAARDYTNGMMMLALASQAGFATSVLTAVTLGFEPDRVTRFPELLSAVTREDVTKAAQDFLSVDGFRGVVLGDAEQLSVSLADLGITPALSPGPA
ncbi:M16 family metallopeptidase [Streptomyces alfalfae]